MKRRRNPSGHEIQPTGRYYARPRAAEPRKPMTAKEVHELKLRQRGVE